MKLKDIKLYISLFIFTLVMSGCISDGDETYVLEEPGIEASKMIIGGWRKSNVKVLDEDGNEVHNSAIEGSLEEIPDITFDEEGHTLTEKLKLENGISLMMKSTYILMERIGKYIHLGRISW